MFPHERWVLDRHFWCFFCLLFTGIRHLPHVLTVPPTKACLLCTTPTGMDLYIQLIEYSPLDFRRSSIACNNINAHVKNPQTLAPIPWFGHRKLLHTLIGMGSAVLAAAVPVPRVGDPNFLHGINAVFNPFKMHSIKSRCAIGPENILFAGVSVHLLARKFYRLGQWRG